MSLDARSPDFGRRQMSRDHSRDGETEEYRGAVLTRAWAGHINVTRKSDNGFVGGWPTTAEAKRAIDGMLGPVV